MNEAATYDGARYVFQVNESEAVAFRRLLIKNQKPYMRRSLIIGIPLLGFASLMIAVLVAYISGWLPISAALTAELAFFVGHFGLLISLNRAAHRVHRDLFRQTKSGQVSFDCTFDDTGIIVKKGALETRMTWDAISRIQDEGPVVAFWYDLTQGFCIPARVFGDAAARLSFAAWAAERVRAAA